MLDGRERELALAACDAIEKIAAHGDGWRAEHPAMRSLAEVRASRAGAAAREALRWAFDSVGAAQGALDFPVDATVTASAQRCVHAVCADRRVSEVQVAIVVASDVDQIAFACGEAHVRTYDRVGAHVLGRLAPCHALTLTAPSREPEEERR